ncbi:MAG: hypothetical protein ACREQ2_05235 [Candidatus Binatia bacterium]
MDIAKSKAQLKTELKQVFRAMNFVSKHLNARHSPKATQHSYFDVYQSLGLAWDFLGLQCRHWDGFKRNREGKNFAAYAARSRMFESACTWFPSMHQRNSVRVLYRIQSKCLPPRKRLN